MNLRAALLVASLALTIPAEAYSHAGAGLDNNALERLGTVSFPVSCAASTQSAFNRGVALLHDFWYEEARRQFEQIASQDPSCAMAHWGLAMSFYHQIWNRPDQATLTRGWTELQKAQSPKAQTAREQEYIAALSDFYKPGKQVYQARIDAYSKSMATLYSHQLDDVDAAAFYGLALLADTAPDDTSLSNERKALGLLSPLFVKYPDHPGLAHYIIHACDTPSLAPQGLHASQRYGLIAPSGAHAAHMPAHIFARLGMWPEDIQANLAAVVDSQKDAADHGGGGTDQLHADDFLLYAYLQSGQDAQAKALLDSTSTLLKEMAHMPGMSHAGMESMVPAYTTKFPVFYALERRNWKTAAALQPSPGAPAEVQTLTYWARAIAHGHLKDAEGAKADLQKYDSLLQELKKGKHAYYVDSTGTQIEHGIVLAWASYADGTNDKALSQMRDAADLQDKVGQGEVDIPAREMLADMLLDLQRPQDALPEYARALQLSPNRFNGLYNAAIAADKTGDKTKAREYYAALLKVTGNGAHSERPELAQASKFVADQ